MATDVNVGSLRNEWAQAMAEQDAPPVETPPNEPAGSTPADPASPAEPTQPDAPAPAEPAPEGSQPAETQSADVPDPDLAHALDLAGAKDVPETERLQAIVKAFIATNKRAAETAKELKALRGNPASPPTTEPPATTQATPATPPPVQAQPPAPPAAPPADVDALIEQQATETEKSDETCRAYAAQCDETAQQIATLIARDPKTRAFVGELPDLDEAIANVKAHLSPAARIKGRLPELDPVDKANLEDDLRRLEFERLTKVAGLRDLRASLKETEGRLEGRRGQIRQYFREQHDAARQEQEFDSVVQTKAGEYRGQFQAEFDRQAKAHGITDPDDLKELYDNLKAKGNQHELGADKATSIFASPQALTAFLAAGFKAEKARMDRYHRQMSKEYAEKKLGDSKQPAPPASAAVAAPLPTQSTDWEKALKADYRAAARP